MFLAEIRKNNVYPCKPQFYYIKVGFKGVNIIWACFRDGLKTPLGKNYIEVRGDVLRPLHKRLISGIKQQKNKKISNHMGRHSYSLTFGTVN